MDKVNVSHDEYGEQLEPEAIILFNKLLDNKRMKTLVDHSFGDPISKWINLREIQKVWPF